MTMTTLPATPRILKQIKELNKLIHFGNDDSNSPLQLRRDGNRAVNLRQRHARHRNVPAKKQNNATQRTHGRMMECVPNAASGLEDREVFHLLFLLEKITQAKAKSIRGTDARAYGGLREGRSWH